MGFYITLPPYKRTKRLPIVRLLIVALLIASICLYFALDNGSYECSKQGAYLQVDSTYNYLNHLCYTNINNKPIQIETYTTYRMGVK